MVVFGPEKQIVTYKFGGWVIAVNRADISLSAFGSVYSTMHNTAAEIPNY